ncbi:MAG: hypothetical protein LBJ89_00700 [Holosporales bacterium]|jgi:hypothetical protein|nr:hypothetical protein [Holosporales bacterium]
MSDFAREFVTDFNDIGTVGDELIPAGTIVSVRMTVRSGGYGPEQMLTKSRGTGALYLNTMSLVTEGPYILRRIFHRFGVYSNEQGNDWIEKGLRQLRAVLESARNILPSDISETAKNARKVASYKDFDGLEFLIKVGIETPKNPQYKTENCMQCVVTPDWKEYAEYKANQGLQVAWPLLKRG